MTESVDWNAVDDIYSRKGRPITLEEHRLLRGIESNRVVCKTYLDGYEISTVWIGYNHNYSKSGPPILFETLVFDPNNSTDEYLARCATEKEALIQHHAAVKYIWEKLNKDKLV